MVSDAFLSDARQLLSETFDGILETLDGLDADRLNAGLDLEGANSLAVIAVHASKSARTWSAVAMGGKLPDRDRPAEFRTVVDSPDVPVRRVTVRGNAREARRVPGLPPSPAA